MTELPYELNWLHIMSQLRCRDDWRHSSSRSRNLKAVAVKLGRVDGIS